MDPTDMEKLLDFMNWKIILGTAAALGGWMQVWKRYLPSTIKGMELPIAEIFLFASGLVFGHFLFDLSGVPHTEKMALCHGVASALVAALGYEILKGTKLGLRSASEMKEDPPKP